MLFWNCKFYMNQSSPTPGKKKNLPSKEVVLSIPTHVIFNTFPLISESICLTAGVISGSHTSHSLLPIKHLCLF